MTKNLRRVKTINGFMLTDVSTGESWRIHGIAQELQAYINMYRANSGTVKSFPYKERKYTALCEKLRLIYVNDTRSTMYLSDMFIGLVKDKRNGLGILEGVIKFGGGSWD